MVSIGNRTRITLRIPAKIDEALKQQAKMTCRSQNSLISEILQSYVAEKILHCSVSDLGE